jgi:predicted Zn-dependent peptidase
MLRPSLDPTEFDTEKKVILEEIALYQDRPNYLLYEAAMHEHFMGHPAGNSVLGNTDSIGALTREQMKGYFDARYAPSNIVFGIAGSFNWDQFVEKAEKLCGHWKDMPVERDTREHHPKTSTKTITKDGLQCAHLCFVSRGPDCRDERRYPCHTLASVLGDSTGSRVYWELVDRGIADIAFIDAEELEGTGVVWGYVSALPDQLDRAGEILRGILHTPLEFNEGDLQRVKTKLRTRFVLNGESSTRRLMALGFEWMYRKRFVTIDDELKRLDLVSRDEIAQLVNDFSLEPVTEVRLLPAG